MRFVLPAGLAALLALAPSLGEDQAASAAAPAAAAPQAPASQGGAATPQAATPPSVPECHMTRFAELDLDMDWTGRVTIPVAFNDNAARMMVDTGTSDSELTFDVARRLKLETGFHPQGLYLMGVGGRIDIFMSKVAKFSMGRMTGHNMAFFLTTADFDSDGLIGGDVLHNYDLDFDFARAVLSIYAPEHCGIDPVSWTKGQYGVVPFEIENNHIMLNVELDGQAVKAVLDTGAADTVMSLDMAAKSFDVDRSKLNKTRHYPFKTLSFGEVSVHNPSIQLIPDDESRVMGHRSSSLHMILGMGVLRRLHLYISYKEKKIYVTPATQY